MYFIGKGNLKYSLSELRVTSKIALHVCMNDIGINDNLEDTKKAIVERCKKVTI